MTRLTDCAGSAEGIEPFSRLACYRKPNGFICDNIAAFSERDGIFEE